MTRYTLKLSFDLRQVTQSLAYKFVLKDNSEYPMEGEGPLAGTFNFQKGDEVCVEVIASSVAHLEKSGATAKDVLENFTVTNCTFVSIPANMTEHLSLFDKTNACTVLSDEWDEIQTVSLPEDEGKNIKRMSRLNPTLLPVKTKDGQWKISGYLSVELTTMTGNTHAQLYFFDPEGSSGYGGGVGP